MKRVFSLLLFLFLFFALTPSTAETLETVSLNNGINAVCTNDLDFLYSALIDGATAFVWNGTQYGVVTFTDCYYLYIKSVSGCEEWKIDADSADETKYLVVW